MEERKALVHSTAVRTEMALKSMHVDRIIKEGREKWQRPGTDIQRSKRKLGISREHNTAASWKANAQFPRPCPLLLPSYPLFSMNGKSLVVLVTVSVEV